MNVKETKQVQDYWKFTRELKAQLNVIRLMERKFFELDDLCEWAIKNDVTVLDDKTGNRISVVDDCLNEEQAQVYEKMYVEAGKLYDMLMKGRSCFKRT